MVEQLNEVDSLFGHKERQLDAFESRQHSRLGKGGMKRNGRRQKASCTPAQDIHQFYRYVQYRHGAASFTMNLTVAMSFGA